VRAKGPERASSTRRGAFVRLSGWIVVAIIAFAVFLRFSDGPVLVFPGGRLRSGEPMAFDAVDWRALDRLRELELEVERTGRSRLLWFSVYQVRPYFSCGFGCEGGWPKRWPHHVERDARVVLRLDGKRIEARLERVSEQSPEYAAARKARQSKFGSTGGRREAAERDAALRRAWEGRRQNDITCRLEPAVGRQVFAA